jgi:hypothetical protein
MTAAHRAGTRPSCHRPEPPHRRPALPPGAFRLAAAIALACAGAARAEGWEFRLSSDTITPASPSITVTLAAGFPATDFAFAAANWNAHASETGWSAPELLPLQIPPTLFPCTTCGGIIDGPDVRSISHGQLYGFGFLPDPANPIPVWKATFTVTDFTPREIDLSTTTTRFEVYVEDLGPGSPREPRIVAEGRATIHVIPAPAPLALLGLGAATVVARRRNC